MYSARDYPDIMCEMATIFIVEIGMFWMIPAERLALTEALRQVLARDPDASKASTPKHESASLAGRQT